MDTDYWTVAEAKAKLSEVIERAQKGGPQTITRNGRRAVVVVDAEEWERRTKRSGNLAEFFAASPLRGSGLKLRRAKVGYAQHIYELSARHDALGRPITATDALIAATAQVHALQTSRVRCTLVRREKAPGWRGHMCIDPSQPLTSGRARA